MGKKERLNRTEMLIGTEALKVLENSHVAVFGIGGVGGSAVEALARAGIGKLTLVDKDVVDESNINRQVIATYDTIGMDKIEVAKKRILSICTECTVDVYKQFVLPGQFGDIGDFSRFDYVIDAIDNVSGKIGIIVAAKDAGVPVISAMGAGNKMDPEKFSIDDISKTKVCPLAKIMRKKIRDLGIKDVAALYSTEEPIKTGSKTPGSMSYIPPLAGLMIGGYVIQDLIKRNMTRTIE